MGPGHSKNTRVLVIDDEGKFCSLVESFLAGRGYTVATASTSSDALVQMERFSPEVIVMDLVMPGLSGLELLKLAKDRTFPPRVIMVTAVDADQVAHQAMSEGAQAFMSKPVDLDALERLISGIWPASNQ